MTGFLAAFAMLYIVGQDLPKLDQTTSIDRIINLTTVTIVGLAVGSCRVYHTHKKMCNVFLFVFPTHQPLTFSTHERGLIPQI
eukprot:SAG25_NODE_10672_length_326_cov_0.612335_1_plen_82_part_01